MTLEAIFHKKSSRKRFQSFLKLISMAPSFFETYPTFRAKPSSLSLYKIARTSLNDILFPILKRSTHDNCRNLLSLPKRVSSTPFYFSHLARSRCESSPKVFQSRETRNNLPSSFSATALSAISLCTTSIKSNLLILSQDHREISTNLSTRLQSSLTLFALVKILTSFADFTSSIASENAAIERVEDYLYFKHFKIRQWMWELIWPY